MSDGSVCLSLQMAHEGPKYSFGLRGVSDRKLLAAAYGGKSCTRFEQVLKVLEVQKLLPLVSGSSERPQHCGSPCTELGLPVSAVVPALYPEILQKALMSDEKSSYSQGLNACVALKRSWSWAPFIMPGLGSVGQLGS